MKLIKEAQDIRQQSMLVIESATNLDVPFQLLESLDGVLQSYVQKINGGQMKNLDYGDISALSNILAFSTMLGVLKAPDLDSGAAGELLNVYKTARPGDNQGIVHMIDQAVSTMDQSRQASFSRLATSWGRSLSHTIQTASPEAMQQLSNRLLKAVHIMSAAMSNLEQHHGDAIVKRRASAGRLSSQLGMKPAPYQGA